MPKRKSSNVEDKLHRLLKKVKKLEKQVRKRDDEVCPSTSDINLDYDHVNQLSHIEISEQPLNENNDSPVDAVITEDCDQALAQCSGDDVLQNSQVSEISIAQPDLTNTGENPSAPATNVVDVTDLDEEILEILGDDPTSTVNLGPEIRKELASRFQYTATEGLSKEVRKELISKYPLPANCLQVGAPTLNPEIKAALAENILKRDKGIETKQREMSSAISCLTEVISSQLTSKENNNDILKKLMDIGRILCDIQHGDSVTRRNFILFSVKNDMQEHLKSTKIDTALFGQQLSETLKTAKAVNKSGAELKIDTNKTASKKTSRPAASQPLNRKAAPPRRHPGAAPYAPRTREWAAPRALPAPPPPQRAHSYRTSSTQRQPPPPPSRRRF